MVVLASPGMIHGGSSLTLFKEWCGSRKNSVIIPGFCMKGTIGGQILRGAETVLIHGRRYDVNCKVCSYSFSAHADYAGIMQLIDKVRPQHLMLVHGEKSVMQRFTLRFKNLVGLPCHSPLNGSVLSIDRCEVHFLPELKPPLMITSPQSKKQKKKSRVFENKSKKKEGE